MAEPHFYEVVAYARTPNISSAPTLTFLQRIIALGGASSGGGGLSWSRELCSDGSIIVSTSADVLKGGPLATRLLNLRSLPVELWMYRDGVLVGRGPLIAWQVEGNSVVLNARGMLYYTRYMALTADLEWEDDQADLVAALIDHHQDKDYGHFGLDTSGITPHSVDIVRDYKRVDLINIYEEIYTLGENENGFDLDYDPVTGDVLLYNPERGTDKSATVFLDSRGITNPNIAYSLSAKQFATAAAGSGSNGDLSFFSESLGIYVDNFGLSYVTTFVTGTATATDVAGYTTQARKLSEHPYFVPSREFFPVVGAALDDFEPGDIVTFAFDPGFGLVEVAQTVKNQNISVGPDGLEKLAVEFI